AFKVSSGELPVPRPVVFRIGGGVYPCVTSASLYIPLKADLLGMIEHIACRVEENHCLVLSQRVFIEVGRIFSSINLKTLFPAKFKYCRLPCGDRLMPEPFSLAEDKNAWTNRLPYFGE